MAVVIDCPSCQRKLRLPEKKLGHPLKCPACSHRFTPPAGPAAISPAASPAVTAPAEDSPALPGPSEPPPAPIPEETAPPPTTPAPDANGTAAAPAPVETTLQPIYVESNWLLDTLFFRKMITPLFIQLLFWGGLLLSVLGGAAGIVLGLFGDKQVNLQYVLVGVFLILPGPILIRVGCEILLVIFYIYDTLMEIKRNTAPLAKPPDV